MAEFDFRPVRTCQISVKLLRNAGSEVTFVRSLLKFAVPAGCKARSDAVPCQRRTGIPYIDARRNA